MLQGEKYIKQESYDYGLVCHIDILGFTEISKKPENFKKIKDLFNDILVETSTEKLNPNLLTSKTSLYSDSILVTDLFKKFDDDDSHLNTLIEFACYVRMLVRRSFNTDIRAAIVLGQYVHCGINDSAFFGPAIIEAYEICEKRENFGNDLKFLNHDAAIIVDRNMFAKIIEPNFSCDKQFGRFEIIDPYIAIYENPIFRDVFLKDKTNKHLTLLKWLEEEKKELIELNQIHCKYSYYINILENRINKMKQDI